MSYIEQYDSARTKIQDTRKCISHPKNLLVCYIILYLIFIKMQINNYTIYLFFNNKN